MRLLKHILLLTGLNCSFIGLAQDKDRFYSLVDTLEEHDNRVHAILSSYKNDTLFEKAEVLLYPIEIKLPRNRLFGRFLMKTMSADSIVTIKTIEKHNKNGTYFISSTEPNKPPNTQYFDSSGAEISYSQYLNKKYSAETQSIKIICGTPTGLNVLIHGKKRRKKNDAVQSKLE